MDKATFTDSSSIAAVVVTYNRCAELDKTLHAIHRQGIGYQDIIVIDNNSKDGTEAMVAQWFGSVHYVRLTENIASAGGFAKGMEIAYQAGYQWVWLFNDDSRPVRETLSSVRHYLDKRQELRLGMLKVANRNERGEAVLLYWTGVRKPVYVPVSDQLIRTDLVTFDGSFISRDLIERIGVCDPLYFMGTYEFDYCLKASAAGFNIYTVPNGLIEDGKLGSVGGTPPWRQYYNTRNHLRLALHLRSWKIFRAWLVRECKYTVTILLKGDRKLERMMYKLLAVKDAFIGKRGRVYGPGRS